MKNNYVELLRGFLMIWIVLFHYTTRYNELFTETFPYEFENGGVIGVTFFFIISGYFFYSRIQRSEKLSICSIGKFCINKYWRLYPAYFISISIIFVTYQFVELSGRECSFKDFLINVISIYHPFSSYVDSAHWFIATLIKIQVLSSIFLIFKCEKRNIIIILFELFIFSLLIYSNNYSNSCVDKLIFIFSPDSFLKFLLGYNIYMFIMNTCKLKYFHLCIMTVIICYYCITINILYVLFYSLVTYLVLQNSFNYIVPDKYNILLMIGKYSFTWYLIHQNIGFVIISKLQSFGVYNELSILIPMVITFGLALAIQQIVDLFPRKIF